MWHNACVVLGGVTPIRHYTAGTRQVVSDAAQRRRPTPPYPRRALVRREPIALRGRCQTVGRGRTWCVASVVYKGAPWPARQSPPPVRCALAGRPYVSRLRCDMLACSQTCSSYRRVTRDSVWYATLTWAAICHG